jgi:hypothetical protein
MRYLSITNFHGCEYCLINSINPNEGENEGYELINFSFLRKLNNHTLSSFTKLYSINNLSDEIYVEIGSNVYAVEILREDNKIKAIRLNFNNNGVHVVWKEVIELDVKKLDFLIFAMDNAMASGLTDCEEQLKSIGLKLVGRNVA